MIPFFQLILFLKRFGLLNAVDETKAIYRKSIYIERLRNNLPYFCEVQFFHEHVFNLRGKQAWKVFFLPSIRERFPKNPARASGARRSWLYLLTCTDAYGAEVVALTGIKNAMYFTTNIIAIS